jgi:DNA replication licensing factor MCM3
VVLENDLVDKVKPGDRVEVTGVFRCEAGKTAGVFNTKLVATGVKNIILEKEKVIMNE